jgi:hypothetical protein
VTSVAVPRAGLVALALAATACGRDALDDGCPTVAAGDLAVTELRGPQDDADGPNGQWIELYATRATSLGGLQVDVTKLDGSDGGSFLVRADLDLAAGAYAVLGGFPAGEAPAHVDYAYGDDLGDDLFATAAITIAACGVEVDRIIYRDLTDFGTLALDGAIDPPSAAANDDETAFCVDDRLDDSNPTAGAGGTPGASNPPCP